MNCIICGEEAILTYPALCARIKHLGPIAVCRNCGDKPIRTLALALELKAAKIKQGQPLTGPAGLKEVNT